MISSIKSTVLLLKKDSIERMDRLKVYDDIQKQINDVDLILKKEKINEEETSSDFLCKSHYF